MWFIIGYTVAIVAWLGLIVESHHYPIQEGKE